MYDRAVLHLDLDAFFVMVEVLKDSSLKGKPVIIGGSSNRGVVASCSYEARRFGVRSAMPAKLARRLCPDAIFLRGDSDAYSKYSKLVGEIIEMDAPLYEKASIDEFYVDLSGMDKHVGCYKWSVEMRERIIKESGLPISFGLSVNKLVSKMGTNEAKPNGKIGIIKGTEKEFIAPMSVSKIPSVGNKTYRRLRHMGIDTVKRLSLIPPRYLEREFGKTGTSLWKKANALDDSPVVPFREQKSMSKERTFQKDTIDVRFLRRILRKMVADLAFELRKQNRITSCLTLKIRYTDFNTHTLQRRIAYTSSDRKLDKIADELFEKLYSRRQLVRLIGVKFSGLVSGNLQTDLFDDQVSDLRLMQAMDKIRKKHGTSIIRKASTL